MVEREAEGVIAAAIVTDDIEPVVTQTVHRRAQVTGPDSFGVGRWSAAGNGLVGSAVPG